MAANLETDIPSSPTNEDSGDEDEEAFTGFKEEQEEQERASSNDVATLLKKLHSSGALITKPKEEYHCFTCNEDFVKWSVFENHLLKHVSKTVYVSLDKLPDLESDTAASDEDWSDEDGEMETPQVSSKIPQKINLGEIMKNPGLSIKPKSSSSTENPGKVLDKLSGLGFTIKNTTPVKEEKPETNNLIKKLGSLGGLKLKLKSDGNNTHSFSVVNGLKDFKTSDNEDSDEDIPPDDDHMDDSEDEKMNQDNSPEQESDDENASANEDAVTNKNRLTVKTTVQPIKILKASIMKPPDPAAAETPATSKVVSATAQNNNMSNISNSQHVGKVVVKEEFDDTMISQKTTPMLSNEQIKSERLSPGLSENACTAIPATAKVKVENEDKSGGRTTRGAPLLVPKKEEIDIIEINCDSNDEDDDCCVVSTTPAPEVKPTIVPKSENSATPTRPHTPYSTKQSSGAGNTQPSQLMNSITNHNYCSYNDSKPLVDLGEKVDDIFDSLFSPNKKDNSADSNEYISLDKLGSQHTCDVCNTRFTDPAMLDMHIRNTGHTKTIVTAGPPGHLLPYKSDPPSSILSSFFPVKQLSEQVEKLSHVGTPSSNAFTHQQNVMINIQYPGAGGIMPNQPYNAYGAGQMGSSTYPNNTNMYSAPGQQMPGQNYPGANYMGQQSFPGQTPYTNTMPKETYPGADPMGAYSAARNAVPFSPSPMQSMQQAYGQTPNVPMAPGQLINPMAPGMPMNATIPGQPINHMVPGQPMNSMPGQPISSMPGQPINSMSSQLMNSVPGQPMTSTPGQPPTSMAPGSMMNLPAQNFPPVSSPSGLRTSSGSGIKIKSMVSGPTTLGQRAPGPGGGSPRMRPPGARSNVRPGIRPGMMVGGSSRVKGSSIRMPLKRPGPPAGPASKRSDLLLPGKHDNEDCQVMSLQKQQEGMPLIQRVQGAKDKVNIGKQITITKKPGVNREANAMANVLASRGIMVKQKQKSRSPSPQRPVPHIPNLGSDVSVKHTGGSRSNSFTIPEAKVGGGLVPCKACGKMFASQSSLSAHMNAAHPYEKISMFKCDECPASYSHSLQLQHHKRVFHTVFGSNRELGLPVVDFSQEQNLRKLKDLGIYSFIPLANREQATGCFGIPVISTYNARNGMTDALHALGADGLLSLGPLKTLPDT